MPTVAAEDWPPSTYAQQDTDDGPQQATLQDVAAISQTRYQEQENGPLLWSIGHVKCRRERLLLRQLTSYKVPYYLPLIPTLASNGTRCSPAYQPLLMGYVFFRGNTIHRTVVTRSEHIYHYTAVNDQSQLYRDLLKIETAIASASATTYSQLVPGRTVVIKQGHPMEGTTGYINMMNKRQVIIQVTTIGASYAVDIDAKWLEPIH